MDNLDIYEDILDHTENYHRKELFPVKSLNEVFLQLSLAQLTEENIQAISFEKEKARFARLLEGFDYKMILKKYQYVELMNLILDEFKPTRKEPYKKLAKAVFASAKYLIRFQDFDHYKKHLALRCNNEEHTFEFLEQFRMNASIPSMLFNKTCLFFQKTGLLDVPYVSLNAKRFFMEEYNYNNNNAEIYLAMVSLAKDNHVRCYELNDRLDCYYSK